MTDKHKYDAVANDVAALAMRISEGFQSDRAPEIEAFNAFHRPVSFRSTTDLSYINGLAMTGLRGTAYLGASQLTENYVLLEEASRLHLPVVIHTPAFSSDHTGTAARTGYRHIHAVRDSGAFQLVASTQEEGIFLGLIAQRIAEQALIPGIVIWDFEPGSPSVQLLPPDTRIREYLGQPDDRIDCPTPAQEIIFGKTRRRIPSWYDLDVPGMIGAAKSEKDIAFETAASRKFFQDHLPFLIQKAFEEFNTLFRTNIEPVADRSGKKTTTIISCGGAVKGLVDNDPQIRSSCGDVLIRQLQPFPAEKIRKAVEGQGKLAVLEVVQPGGLMVLKQEVAKALDPGRIIYSLGHSGSVNAGLLQDALAHVNIGYAESELYLGIEFFRESRDYPKQEILMQEIDRRYPGINDGSIPAVGTTAEAGPHSRDTLPLSVRRYADSGPAYSRLSRFYNNTAFFQEDELDGELVADPYSATPFTPALSASLISASKGRTLLPVLDNRKCTGCGACFLHCPHSAIPPTAFSAETLLRTGAEMAAGKGRKMLGLPSIYKNLGAMAHLVLKDKEVADPKEFLPEAFRRLAEKTGLEGKKLEDARADLDAVISETGSMSAALTAPFFTGPEAMERGSGGLFTLAIDPDTCTGCGLCTDICPDEALTMQPATEDLSETVRERFRIWEQLPDIDPHTIKRLHQDKDYDTTAALLLSRNYHMTMAGTTTEDSGSGFKSLVHLVHASAEAVMQPRMVGLIRQIEKLTEDITLNIRKQLNDALPADDLDHLVRALQPVRGRKRPLHEIIELAGQDNDKLIDTASVSRKAELTEELRALKWSLENGPEGVGRARFGMILAGSDTMDWARQYPANPFSAPAVIHWNASAPERAVGIFHGQLRHILDNIKLLRRAGLEAADKYDPAAHDAAVARLSWDDLTDEERLLVPPLLLIAERSDLDRSGWNSLNRLLAEPFPIKVFLLNDLAPGFQAVRSEMARAQAGLLGAIGLKTAFVFQGGMGGPDHLAEGLMSGLGKCYPALFHLYAPPGTLQKSGHLKNRILAQLALASRALPALRYDPYEKSEYISGALSLEGNPSLDQDWTVETVQVGEDDSRAYTVTWADWAFEQPVWKGYFRRREYNESFLPLGDYLALSDQARQNHDPVILRASGDVLMYYEVDPEVVRLSEAALDGWNTFREAAGMLTEFPHKLRTELLRELGSQFDKEKAALEAEFDRRLQKMEANRTEALRQQLKEKLISLAGMARKHRQQEEHKK